MAQVLDKPQTSKKRRGPERRQRDRQLKLRLLPSEEEQLQEVAKSAGFSSIQQYILHRLQQDLKAPAEAS